MVEEHTSGGDRSANGCIMGGMCEEGHTSVGIRLRSSQSNDEITRTIQLC